MPHEGQIHTCSNVMYVWLPLSFLVLAVAGWKIGTTFAKGSPPANFYQKTVMGLCCVEFVGLLLSNIDEARNGGTCEGWLPIGLVWFSIAIAQCCAIVIYLTWLEYTIFWTYDISGRFPPRAVALCNRVLTAVFFVLRLLAPILGGIYNDERYEWLFVAAMVVALVNGLSMFGFTCYNYITKLKNVDDNAFIAKLKQRVAPKLFYGVIVWLVIFLYLIFYTTGGDFHGPYVEELEGENILGRTYQSDNQKFDSSIDTLALIANFLMLSACVWTFFPEFYHQVEALHDLEKSGSKNVMLMSFSSHMTIFSKKMYRSQKKYAGPCQLSIWGAGELHEAYQAFKDAEQETSSRSNPVYDQ